MPRPKPSPLRILWPASTRDQAVAALKDAERKLAGLHRRSEVARQALADHAAGRAEAVEEAWAAAARDVPAGSAQSAIETVQAITAARASAGTNPALMPTLRAKDRRPLPRGWCWATIGQVADVASGGTPDKRHLRGGVFPFVTSGAITGDEVRAPATIRDPVERTERPAYITARGLLDAGLVLHPPGCVLVALIGAGKGATTTRGKVAVLRIAAAVNQALGVIRLDGPAMAYLGYIHLWMRSNQAALRALSLNANNIALPALRGLAVPLPPARIADRVAAAVARRLADHESEGERLTELVAQVEAERSRALVGLGGGSGRHPR